MFQIFAHTQEIIDVMSKSSVKFKCQLWLQHSCYRFGRRLAVVASCVPLVLGWVVTWQASQLGHLYIARSEPGLSISIL